MAVVLIPGGGMWWPQHRASTGSNMSTFTSIGTIDATGEKLAMLGPVWTPNYSTKTLSTIGFRFGAVTKAGGSGLTVSVQNWDATTGAPWQPDGTQDQTAAVANGNASFATNTWIELTLASTRNVSYGDLLAVVVEYDGSGRLGADSVIVQGVNQEETRHSSGTALFTASWAAQNLAPNVLLGFNDGTVGRFMGGTVLSNMTSLTVNTGTTPDEVAMRFQVPFACQIDAVQVALGVNANTADYEVILYDSGSTALFTIARDANQVHNNTGSAPRCDTLECPLTDLAANTTYRLAVKPTTANSVLIPYYDVSSAAHLGATYGGTACHYSSRSDGGGWTDLTTRRPSHFMVSIAGPDTGGSSGIGALVGGSLTR